MAEWTRKIPGLTELVAEFLESEATGIEKWEKLKITLVARNNGKAWVVTESKEVSNRESRPEEVLGGEITDSDWETVFSSPIFTFDSNVAADHELREFLQALRENGNAPADLDRNVRGRFNYVMKRTPYRLMTKTRKYRDTDCFLAKLYAA